MPLAPPYRVLFVCTGNSARSILAEAILNDVGRGRFVAVSAGSHPEGSVHPLALQTLGDLRTPAGTLWSKSWEDFAGPAAAPLHFVITVCDRAAGELCPVWPGQPVTAHWGVPDPALASGSGEDQARAFMDTALLLARRIHLLLALPVEKLEKLALQSELHRIGTVKDFT